jgi:hypothetical protein
MKGILHWTITIFARSTIFTGFDISNTGIVGSNPTRGRYVFLYFFVCFVII